MAPLRKKHMPQIYALNSNVPLPVHGFFQPQIKNSQGSLLCITHEWMCQPDEQLFDGTMGCIKNGKVTLHKEKSVIPVAQTHHQVPFHVRIYRLGCRKCNTKIPYIKRSAVSYKKSLMQAIQTGHWMDSEAKDFNKFKDELAIYDGLILWQNCLIIPITLQ